MTHEEYNGYRMGVHTLIEFLIGHAGTKDDARLRADAPYVMNMLVAFASIVPDKLNLTDAEIARGSVAAEQDAARVGDELAALGKEVYDDGRVKYYSDIKRDEE